MMRYALLFLFISGCGFQLRQNVSVQQQPVAIVVFSDSVEIQNALVHTLSVNNIATAAVSEAQSRIEIIAESEENQRALATADSEENLYTLRWQFHYFIRDVQWQQVIAHSAVQTNALVNTRLIEKHAGKSWREIRQELRERLARLLLRQIAVQRQQA